ncbi:hypothetical protein [Flavobacterium sp. C4GT6]|uniref:hypothetical protein n=1 Tax=Flavobacterium sp. C4GT6 TaxID=3103818 RepID=UPI002ED0A5AD
MNDLEFYKSIYDRELNRRTSLDDSVSNILTSISILIGVIWYFYSNVEYKSFIRDNNLILVLLGLAFLLLLFSMIFLIKSYNNFLRGFNYPNIAYLQEVRAYQTEGVVDYNKRVKANEQISFEEKLIDRLIRITDENTRINDRRAYDMYVSKTLMIISLSMLVFPILILITKTL